MEEKGYYKRYEQNFMNFHECNVWMSSEQLGKLIYNLAFGNIGILPKLDQLRSETNVLNRAPFGPYKRFPSTGYYAEIGCRTVWFIHFKKIAETSLEDSNYVYKVHNMLEDFELGNGLYNRESFEEKKKVDWKPDNRYGYYAPYEGRIIFYETQMWILDKLLLKMIYDSDKTPLKISENTEYCAPFSQDKRFPSSGKYARVGLGTIWFELFDQHKNNQNNQETINKMLDNFEKEADMFNRDLFEKTMKIQWKYGLNPLHAEQTQIVQK